MSRKAQRGPGKRLIDRWLLEQRALDSGETIPSLVDGWL